MAHFRVRAQRLFILLIAGLALACTATPEMLRQRPRGACLSRLEEREFKTERNEDGGRICVLSALPSVKETVAKEQDLAPTMFGPKAAILSGLDLAAASGFRLLEGRSFALFTNATGLDKDLNGILDLLARRGLRPEIILEPEHGLYGALDSMQSSLIRVDRESGLRVLSLYSGIRKPLPSHLVGVDTMVIDIQSLPVRCYTYATTLTYLLETAEENHIEVLLLDRPHPYGIWDPAGSYPEEGFLSFVGTAPVPFLYSMTPGEYAIYIAKHRYPSLHLRVLKVEGFHPDRMDWVLASSWINPSPNIPDLESALVYAGFVFFEGTNISLGRGTTRPFVYSGAPWVRDRAVVEELKKLNLKGVRFGTVSFVPSASLYAGFPSRGVQFHPYSKEFDPLRTGYEYMRILRRLHPNLFRINMGASGAFLDRLWGGPGYREAIEHDLTFDEFRRTWINDAQAFRNFSRDSMIYGPP